MPIVQCGMDALSLDEVTNHLKKFVTVNPALLQSQEIRFAITAMHLLFIECNDKNITEVIAALI